MTLGMPFVWWNTNVDMRLGKVFFQHTQGKMVDGVLITDFVISASGLT